MTMHPVAKNIGGIFNSSFFCGPYLINYLVLPPLLPNHIYLFLFPHLLLRSKLPVQLPWTIAIGLQCTSWILLWSPTILENVHDILQYPQIKTQAAELQLTMTSLPCLDLTFQFHSLLSKQLPVFWPHCSFCSSVHEAHCCLKTFAKAVPFAMNVLLPQFFMWLHLFYHLGLGLNDSTSVRLFLATQSNVGFNIPMISPYIIFTLAPVPTHCFLIHLQCLAHNRLLIIAC